MLAEAVNAVLVPIVRAEAVSAAQAQIAREAVPLAEAASVVRAQTARVAGVNAALAQIVRVEAASVVQARTAPAAERWRIAIVN